MIKKGSFLLAFTLLAGVHFAGAEIKSPVVKQAKEVVWAGLDYSKTKMVGSHDFRQPENIFPGMLIAWNELFLEEVMDKLENQLDKTVKADTAGVMKLNKLATAAQIKERTGNKEEAGWTDAQIAAEVAKYKLSETRGVGLVFIVESLEKPDACLDVVWFDIATRKVLDIKDDCFKGGGFGFRNFWFSPIKRAVKELR